jgi:methylamine dehydrogenase accessory protein MauD
MLTASTIAAAIAIALLSGLILALVKQIGLLHRRIAPMGALMMDTGPKIGEAAPHFDLSSLDGAPVALGQPAARNTLLFFLSPDCPVCKKLIPILRRLKIDEAASLDIVLASDGEASEHRPFYEREKLSPFPYVLSRELGLAFRVSRLPFAVLIDRAGAVRAKGLVNSREQIESLLTAHELGVASAQAYLAQSKA